MKIGIHIPVWIILWLIVNSIILYIDAFYVLARPQTLPGGKYFWFYWPYQNYAKFDTLYAMNNDSFVIIQSWLNIFESTLGIIALLIYMTGARARASFMTVIIQSFTLWKTVIFVWYDRDWLSADAKAFTPMSILCYYLPSLVWIIMPILTIWVLSLAIIEKCEIGKSEKIKEN